MTTSLPAIALLSIGTLLLLAGGIWAMVVAFRRSLVWGLCYLFVPFASLVFFFVAWADLRRAFLLHLAGIVVLAGGIFLALPKALDFKNGITAGFEHASFVVTADRGDALQKRLAELTAREQTLRARKAALDPQDIAAARALTDEILRYNADLKAATDEQSGLATGGAGVVSYNPPPK